MYINKHLFWNLEVFKSLAVIPKWTKWWKIPYWNWEDSLVRLLHIPISATLKGVRLRHLLVNYLQILHVDQRNLVGGKFLFFSLHFLIFGYILKLWNQKRFPYWIWLIDNSNRSYFVCLDYNATKFPCSDNIVLLHIYGMDLYYVCNLILSSIFIIYMYTHTNTHIYTY